MREQDSTKRKYAKAERERNAKAKQPVPKEPSEDKTMETVEQITKRWNLAMTLLTGVAFTLGVVGQLLCLVMALMTDSGWWFAGCAACLVLGLVTAAACLRVNDWFYQRAIAASAEKFLATVKAIAEGCAQEQQAKV